MANWKNLLEYFQQRRHGVASFQFHVALLQLGNVLQVHSLTIYAGVLTLAGYKIEQFVSFSFLKFTGV